MSNFRVPPASRAAIEAGTDRIRSYMGTDPQLNVPVLLEYLFPLLRPDFVFEVRADSEMGSMHGHVDPVEKVLALREDVYRGMIAGVGRDRFTTCHEIGHALLHADVTLNRVREKPRPFECPEWQANAFAAGLLMPESLTRQAVRSVSQMVQLFGVSEPAAETRLRVLKMQLPAY